MRASPRWLLAAGLPVAAFLVMRLLGPAGPEGLFRAGLVALVAAVALFAFVPLRAGATLGAAAASAGLLATAHLLGGSSPAAAGAAAALVLGQALAAAGFAGVGRRLGAGGVGAGAVSAALLGLALGGLFWADEAAAHVPAERRWALRQAVVDLDAATALAYDAAGFDRFAHPPVYAGVPLASSSHQAPRALDAAAAWAAFGILTGLVASVGRRRAPEAARA